MSGTTDEDEEVPEVWVEIDLADTAGSAGEIMEGSEAESLVGAALVLVIL